MENRKKILVIGGAGFIGSHFVENFLENGQIVTVFDDLSSGNFRWIERYLTDPNFIFVQGNLINPNEVEKVLKNQDLVLYAGGNSDIKIGATDTYIHLNSNVYGMHNLLEAMRRNSVEEIIFCSSNTVYGELNTRAENSGPLLPVSLFGASKLACEGLISAYCNLFDMRGYIFRLGNVVGGRMHRGVLFDLINKLKLNPEVLEILGDGKQSRSFILVDDVVEGIMKIYNKLSNTNYTCDVYNISSCDEADMQDIVDILIDVLGINRPQIIYTNHSRGWNGDLKNVFLNIEKAKSLGWEATYNSKEALKIAAKRIIAS